MEAAAEAREEGAAGSDPAGAGGGEHFRDEAAGWAEDPNAGGPFQEGRILGLREEDRMVQELEARIAELEAIRRSL